MNLLDRKNILRYPRLDTVLMVEEFIKGHSGEFKRKELWDNLPKKVMWQTFNVILEYLYYSRKISIDAEGKIGWIYNPELVKKYMNKPELWWKGHK